MPKFTLVAPLVVALTVVAAAGARADQLADIKQRGTLMCGILGTAEPFGFPNAQTREIQGYDVDFCAAIAKGLGVKLELKAISIAARIPELQQGRVDVLAAGLSWTPERAEQIAYSDSYFVSRQMIGSRRADGYKSPADLAGKRVASVKGSTSDMAAKKTIPNVHTLTFQDAPSLFIALQQSKVDGVAFSELVLVKWKKEAEASLPIDILEPAMSSEPFGIGMRKGESNLITHVNQVLQSMEKSGEAERVFDKWVGTGTGYNMKRNFRIEPIKG